MSDTILWVRLTSAPNQPQLKAAGDIIDARPANSRHPMWLASYGAMCHPGEFAQAKINNLAKYIAVEQKVKARTGKQEAPRNYAFVTISIPFETVGWKIIGRANELLDQDDKIIDPRTKWRFVWDEVPPQLKLAMKDQIELTLNVGDVQSFVRRRYDELTLDQVR